MHIFSVTTNRWSTTDNVHAQCVRRLALVCSNDGGPRSIRDCARHNLDFGNLLRDNGSHEPAKGYNGQEWIF